MVVYVCFRKEKTLEKLCEQRCITLCKNCSIISQCWFAHSIWSDHFLALSTKEQNDKTFPHWLGLMEMKPKSLLSGSNLRSYVMVASHLKVHRGLFCRSAGYVVVEQHMFLY